MIPVGAVQDNILRTLIDGNTRSVEELSEKLGTHLLMIRAAVFSLANDTPEWFNVVPTKNDPSEITFKPEFTDMANQLLLIGGFNTWRNKRHEEDYRRKVRRVTIVCWLELFLFVAVFAYVMLR